jgi:4-hydroxybenzoate polyprenyltransferase
MVTWLGRKRALGVSALLHLLAFISVAVAALGAVNNMIWPHPFGTPSFTGLAAMALFLAVAGALLFLEQRWAENVNLAFFKVNVWVSFFVLLMVLASHVRG